MNKYVCLTMGLLMISTMTDAASCAGGAGITVTGVDGVTYCKSRISMNWWSAFAWCEGANMTLISLDDCNGKNGNITGEVSYPNFDHTGSGIAWTSSVPHGAGAYWVNLSSGNVITGILARNAYNGAALCKE